MHKLTPEMACHKPVDQAGATANMPKDRLADFLPSKFTQSHGRWRRLAPMAFGLALMFSPGVAAAAEEVIIIGLGSSTCASFLEDIATKPKAQREYFSWAQGYMSGLLIRAPVGENVTLNPAVFPLAKQAIFLEMFCTNNKNSRFSDGVEKLYRLLRKSTI